MEIILKKRKMKKFIVNVQCFKQLNLYVKMNYFLYTFYRAYT